jgi:hypothetical protein
MGRAETRDELGRTAERDTQRGSDDEPATVNTNQTDLEIVRVELIVAFVSELYQSLRGFLSGQQDIVKTVTQILPELLTDYSTQLSHGEKEGLKKDAAVFVRQHRLYVASTASRSDVHISPFLSRLLLKSILSD